MTPHKDSCLAPCPPTPLLPPLPVLSEALHVCNPHAAGIDIGEAEHWVAVPPGRDPQPVRRFGTCTADLDALADWLMPVATRQCIRPTEPRRLRSAIPRTQGHDHGQAGQGIGVYTGAPRRAGIRPPSLVAPVVPVLP